MRHKSSSQQLVNIRRLRSEIMCARIYMLFVAKGLMNCNHKLLVSLLMLNFVKMGPKWLLVNLSWGSMPPDSPSFGMLTHSCPLHYLAWPHKDCFLKSLMLRVHVKYDRIPWLQPPFMHANVGLMWGGGLYTGSLYFRVMTIVYIVICSLLVSVASRGALVLS